jgi:hypothetical protein
MDRLLSLLSFNLCIHAVPPVSSSLQCRGVVLKLIDVTMMSDAVHRGMGQLMPTTRRIVSASMYTAEPGLLEPVHHVCVGVPLAWAQAAREVISQRGGTGRRSCCPWRGLRCAPRASLIMVVLSLRRRLQSGG